MRRYELAGRVKSAAKERSRAASLDEPARIRLHVARQDVGQWSQHALEHLAVHREHLDGARLGCDSRLALLGGEQGNFSKVRALIELGDELAIALNHNRAVGNNVKLITGVTLRDDGIASLVAALTQSVSKNHALVRGHFAEDRDSLEKADVSLALFHGRAH